MVYIAHKNENLLQTLKAHSENTADIARSFAIDELKDMVYNIALLHDIGKYQPTFQRRIRGEDVKIPHAVCGAKEIDRIYKNQVAAEIMKFCIAGHHSGLHDSGTNADTEHQSTLSGVLKRSTEDFSHYIDELSPSAIDYNSVISFLGKDCESLSDMAEKFDFIVRYCFSCLTDADSLDTEEFYAEIKRQKMQSDFSEALSCVDKVFSEFRATTELQKARSILQAQVYEKTNINANIYLMNMPTGSGKTLCSLKFALTRAINTNKKRIIYIIPYNSIIDQTAQLFESKFKSLNILRHQSSFLYEDEADYSEDYRMWAIKSTENWDADFIVTTAVQFFESIYGNKRGKLRKLHNMADSILIFDEAHLMPIDFLEPCIKSIVNITRYLNSEAVFLTATMPNFPKLMVDKFGVKLSCLDLISDKTMFTHFKKCNYLHQIYEDTAQLISDSDFISRLIIVNSKKTAQQIYKQCSGEVYHLSTYMNGMDRVRVIDAIRRRLLQLEEDYPDGVSLTDERKITVVSTSLIEAGVDLDFHTVYRELAGLDSVLQAGGRCNREGKRNMGNVVVFELKEKKSTVRPEQSITKALLKEHKSIDSNECIEEYYRRLFEIKSEEISANAIYQKGQKPHVQRFKTYAELFNMIDDRTVSIVVPSDDYCKNIMEYCKESGYVSTRKLQKYMVSISFSEFENLHKQGVINDYQTGVFFLTNNDYYDCDIGITFEAKDYYI